MFIKLYEKVINYIKKEYKFLIVLFLIIFLGLFRLPYNLYIGGGTIDLAERIAVSNEYREKGSFNLSYVKQMKATIPTYLLSYIFNWERESVDEAKLDENDNYNDIWKREQLYLKEANDNAIISAYTLANEDIEIKKEILKILYVDKDSETDLEIGDILLNIENHEITEFSDIKDILKDYHVGDKLNVRVLRDEKETDGYFKVREIDGELKAGLYLIKFYEYTTKRDVKLDFSNREGGPSGGFMVSLAIYNRLIPEDLTKGRKIVGTGTITKDGKVGEIGGVLYKLAGAVKGKADIFFVPKDNYDEAIKLKEEYNYKIEIVKVETLQEAVDYLRR